MTTVAAPTRKTRSAAARLIEITEKARPWSLNFAPHIGLSSEEDGMFAPIVGPDPLEQIALIHDLGFTGNFAPIFAELHHRGFEGFVGLEHGQSKPGVGSIEDALPMLSRL
ncbi:MAG: hypothetical protein AAF250_06625 [Pseudomonadota bacterium]